MAAKKRKRDANWAVVKSRLLEEYGNMCWLCHRRYSRNQLTLHHVHPFRSTHKTEYNDSMILCQDCHFKIVNSKTYDTKEYWDLMQSIAENMNNMFDVNIEFKK